MFLYKILNILWHCVFYCLTYYCTYLKWYEKTLMICPPVFELEEMFFLEVPTRIVNPALSIKEYLSLKCACFTHFFYPMHCIVLNDVWPKGSNCPEIPSQFNANDFVDSWQCLWWMVHPNVMVLLYECYNILMSWYTAMLFLQTDY